MAEPTAVDRLLTAVHDYVPKRAQAWIEDRAFLKRVEAVAQETEKSFGSYISGVIDKLERETNPADRRTLAAERLSEDAADRELRAVHDNRFTHNDYTERMADLGPELAALYHERDIPIEELRAAESWRREAGESFMAEKANGAEWKGQPDFFDDSIIPVRAEQKSDVPQVSLKDNVDYQQQRAFYEKQQRNAEAWAVASPVARDANREQGVASVVTLRQ